MTALTPAPVRAKAKRQTPAEKQAVYDAVTARDKTCRAPAIYWAAGIENIRPVENGAWEIECFGKLERHHAFTGTGHKRITDMRHVVLLCEFHHRNWAPTHARLILDWLARIEYARERARHDMEEDAGDVSH
jgi:hypothetical protein